MSVQGGVEEMKSGRVVVSPEAEPMSDIWFYQDGFIKNKVLRDYKGQMFFKSSDGVNTELVVDSVCSL